MDTKSHKLTDARREMFYAELHALLTAGLDFSAAFRLLIEGEGDRRTKALLEELYAAVVRGETLAEAMRRSGAFRPLECGVVRIGDETGRDVWHGHSTSCATTTASGPRSGAWSPRP